jgi:apolipoprotein N-acyltransferase
VAAAVHAGAEWVLAIANLDPYPQLLQRQFLALAQLRSLETIRPLLSAANFGPTASVSAQGKVLDQLAPMQPGVLITALKPQSEQSLYVRWRDRPLGMLLMVAAFWRCRVGLMAISRLLMAGH